MSLFDRLGAAVRKRIHRREIEKSLAHFERQTTERAERRQRFADAGSFRSQVDRLFALGSASETGELVRIAESVVSATLTNRYYRAADYLSDLLDDLERHTGLTGEPRGEPPLSELSDGYPREQKLKAVMEAWLAPLKVAAIENVLAAYSRTVGRSLPYSGFERFERATARLFALVAESEIGLVEDHLVAILERWPEDGSLREHAEPARVVSDLVTCLTGEQLPDGASSLRTRRADQPLRLSTVVPEERQHLIRAGFARWE